jgi:hypothetical protein
MQLLHAPIEQPTYEVREGQSAFEEIYSLKYEVLRVFCVKHRTDVCVDNMRLH